MVDRPLIPATAPATPSPEGAGVSREQIARSSVMTIVGWAAAMATTFVLTPFLVSTLGDARYGIWSLIGAVAFNAHLLLLGVPLVVVRFLAKARFDGDEAEARAIYSTALAYLSAAGLVMMAAGLAVAAAVEAGLAFPETGNREIAVAIAIMSALVAMEFPAAAAGGAIGSVARHDVSSMIMVFRSVARLAAAFLVLTRYPRLDVLAAAALAADLLTHAAMFFWAHRLAPHARFERAAVSLKTLWRALNSGLFTFLSNFANKSLFYFDLMIIGMLMTPVAVAYYSVVVQLIARVQTVVVMAFGVLVPVFAQYASEPKSEALKTRFLFTLRVATCISAFVMGGLAAFGGPFLAAWIAPEYASAAPAILILAAAMTVELAQTPMTRLAVALDSHRVMSTGDLVVGLVNLTLTFALIGPFGLTGVAIGTAIPLLVFGLFVRPAIIASKTAVSTGEVFRAQIRVLAPALALQAPAFLLVREIDPQGLLEVTGLAAAIYGFLGVAIVFCALPLSDIRQLTAVLPARVRAPLFAAAPVLRPRAAD